MFSKLMIPVDLRHVDRMTRAIKIGTDIARTYGATVTFVGVTGVQPSAVAHTPAEYTQKLEAFARDQADAAGIETSAKAIVAHDPTTEIDAKLVDASEEIGADLVVMATHDPRRFEWPSHGGKLASHAHISVLLVRGE